MTTNKAIEILKSYKTYTFTSEENYKESISVEEIIELLQKPVKVGKWWHYEGELHCSVCGSVFYDDIMEFTGDEVPKYCPDCGARMMEG